MILPAASAGKSAGLGSARRDGAALRAAGPGRERPARGPRGAQGRFPRGDPSRLRRARAALPPGPITGAGAAPRGPGRPERLPRRPRFSLQTCVFSKPCQSLLYVCRYVCQLLGRIEAHGSVEVQKAYEKLIGAEALLEDPSARLLAAARLGRFGKIGNRTNCSLFNSFC